MNKNEGEEVKDDDKERKILLKDTEGKDSKGVKKNCVRGAQQAVRTEQGSAGQGSSGQESERSNRLRYQKKHDSMLP